MRLRSRDAPAADPPSVTSRETEVLSLASHGLTAAEIAEQLAISVNTVKAHFDNIYLKLGVSDKAAAVAAPCATALSTNAARNRQRDARRRAATSRGRRSGARPQATERRT